MKTWHIYKADCFGASRVQLQATWDKNAAFIHLHKPGSRQQKQRESRTLSFVNLTRLILDRKREPDRVLVFHAQSSLPYLVFTKSLLRLIGDSTTRLVYDIHDLHEPTTWPSAWQRVRYGIIRHSVLWAMERWACRHPEISTMTVSQGLATVISRWYGCRPPSVVMSAQPPGRSADELSKTERFDRTVLFFGTSERLPIPLLDTLADADVQLHIYGRGISVEGIEAATDKKLPTQVSIFGAYQPDDIEFIERYRFLVLYQPGNTSLNFRHSLPNKLFQALSRGTSLIVSPNFEEVTRVLRDIPGALWVIEDATELHVAMNSLDTARTSNFWDAMIKLASDMNSLARETYLRLTVGRK